MRCKNAPFEMKPTPGPGGLIHDASSTNAQKPSGIQGSAALLGSLFEGRLRSAKGYWPRSRLKIPAASKESARLEASRNRRPTGARGTPQCVSTLSDRTFRSSNEKEGHRLTVSGANLPRHRSR